MKHEPLPASDDVEHRGPDPKREIEDLHELERELEGAVAAAGAEQTQQAIEQVASGEADPKALLAWIDDLRDPEGLRPPDELADVQQGVVPDFIPDTVFAGGAVEVRDPNLPVDSAEDASFFSSKPASAKPFDDDADADYFFSAARRRRAEDDDDSGDAPPEGGEGTDPKDPKGRKATKATKGTKKAAR